MKTQILEKKSNKKANKFFQKIKKFKIKKFNLHFPYKDKY